jgi:hypothetical protein
LNNYMITQTEIELSPVAVPASPPALDVPVGFSCSEVPDPPLLPEPGLSNLSGGGILVFEDAARCELTIAN